MSWKQFLKELWNPTEEFILQAEEQQEPLSSEKTELHLRNLQIRLRKVLDSPYSGDHQRLFKGHGLDFNNLREYQPGDEIRRIDWNVFARTGVPHIKEHLEEKQIPVWFFVDARTPMRFGQRETKLSYSRKLMEVIGLLALEHGHCIGLILWQREKTPLIIKPSKGWAQLQHLAHTLQTVADRPAAPPATEGFPNLPLLFSNRCLVFLFSDFSFLEALPESLPILSRLSPKHEVHTLLLMDPVEKDLIYRHGWLPLQEQDGNDSIWVDTTNPWLIGEYRRAFKRQLRRKARILSPWSRFRPILTSEDSLDAVIKLVKAS